MVNLLKSCFLRISPVVILVSQTIEIIPTHTPLVFPYEVADVVIEDICEFMERLCVINILKSKIKYNQSC